MLHNALLTRFPWVISILYLQSTALVMSLHDTLAWHKRKDRLIFPTVTIQSITKDKYIEEETFLKEDTDPSSYSYSASFITLCRYMQLFRPWLCWLQEPYRTNILQFHDPKWTKLCRVLVTNWRSCLPRLKTEENHFKLKEKQEIG